MPSTLKIEQDDAVSSFYKLTHTYNKRFVDYIRLGIKPLSYRKYDPTTRQWSVHESKLPYVVSYGYKCFDHVDYSSLAYALKKSINDTVAGWKSGKPELNQITPKDPYATLFIIPQAPWEVVKAAHTALAKLHHPDKGGNSDKFIEIQAAYEALKKKHH